ncbi:DMT family transporter [Fodinicurvata sp. EGI_FJ10296]|uniref:DMT family transporter n=1 Tax=Fodinicurvata sp. EGI_FJ10296 TaxID=3231908 RepID=UPI0034545EC5
MSLSNPQNGEAKPVWLRGAPGIFLLLWSLGFPVAVIGVRYAEPMTLLVLRFVCVLAVLVPLAFWLRPPLPVRGRDWADLAIVGFLIQAVYFGLCYVAFSFGASAGAVALIVSLQPIVVALLAPSVVGEAIGRRRWVGLILGLSGAVIVIAARSEVDGTSAIGVLCAVGALMGMCTATLYEKRFGRGHHPVTSNLVQYAVGLAATLPVALVLEGMAVTWSPALAGALAYLVIGNSLIAITLLLAMIRHGEASRVSALFYLVPPTAAVLAWILIGETMPPLAWAGMALAAAGVALASRPVNKGAGKEKSA